MVLSDLEPSDTSVAALLAQKKIKVAVDFLVVANLFLTRTAQAANIVVPLASTAETSGTFTNSERRVQRLRRAIPRRPGLEGWELIAQLAAKMGLRFKTNYDNMAQILDAPTQRLPPHPRGEALDEHRTGLRAPEPVDVVHDR